MKFDVCPAPADTSLAIHNQADTVGLHQDVVHSQYTHWAELEETSPDNPAAAAIAKALSLELRQARGNIAARSLGILTDSDRKAERDRRRCLGTSALSLLLRDIITPAEAANMALAEEEGYSTIAIDMMADQRDMPLPHRLHVLPADADAILPTSAAAVEWYRNPTNGLYLRRETTADASDGLKEMFKAQGVPLSSLDDMVTLFPFLPSRIAT